MTVTFIIPTWNRGDLLAAALASVERQQPAPHQVLVVDNGSTDGSGDIARRAGAEVLRLDRNRGFSFAVNRGVEAARGEAVALVNNDVDLEPDWGRRLSDALDQTTAWFAIGKLLDFARRDTVDGAGDALCRGGTAWRLGHGRADSPAFNQPRRTFFSSATAVMARRELFSRAGKLDEVFFTYLEDVDLGLRAALLGLDGVYVPEAVAYHRGSATLGPGSAQTVEWMTRNQILLLAKFYPAGLLWRFWRPILAAQTLWGGAAILRGHPVAWARGLASGLAGGPALRRSAAAWRANGNRLAEVLLRSEAELVSFQRSTGWDRYWRWYFCLAPCPKETQA